MKTHPAGKWLDCGCCGLPFQTWEGYVDQDQDQGYGICRSCQGEQEQDTEDFYADAYAKILEAVGPETRADMEAKVAKDEKMRNVFVNLALDKGLLKWSIRRS